MKHLADNVFLLLELTVLGKEVLGVVGAQLSLMLHR